MSKRHRRLIGVLLAAGLLLGAAMPGQAELSPPAAPHGASIAPPAETGVRLAAQEVLIEAQRNSSGQAPFARVTASFWLRNEGAADEEMELRFPLSTVDHFGNRQACDLSPFLPLQEFQAWVDEVPLRARTLREKADSTRWSSEAAPPERVLDCWAVFAVRFPAGAEVKIRLSYRQEAGVEGYPGSALYRYALQPAAGWQGPVGSTRVIFRAPWALTAENFPGHAFPIERLVDGLRVEMHENEIHWTFAEIEPDAQADIVVGVMNPAVYSAINRGRMLYPGSRDADTWARYAQAAKQAVLHPRGFRTDADGERLYHESYESYRRAVELRPWSSAWQAGFAELLCVNAAFPTFDLEWSEEERWQACARHLKAALDLNPQQELALHVLDEYALDGRYITLQDGQPAFPILDQAVPPRSTPTPLPSATPTATDTPVTTDTPVATDNSVSADTPVATEMPAETQPAPTGTAAQVEESPVAAAVAAATEAAPPPTGSQTYFLAALLPLAALIALIASLRKRQ